MPEFRLSLRWRDRRVRIGLLTAVVLAALAYPGVSLVVADRLTKPYRRPLASSPAVFGLSYEDVTFPSAVDAVPLRGWFLPVGGSDRVVVIVHGRNSSSIRRSSSLREHSSASIRQS